MSAQDDRVIRFTTWYPLDFALDPDGEGDEIPVLPLRIKRFDVDEGKTYDQQRARILDPPSARAIYRRGDADEQAHRGGEDKGPFVVSDDEIRRRRIQEMTVEVRAAFEAQEAIDLAVEYDYLVDVVKKYVSVAPGVRVLWEPEEGDPFQLRTGADLIRAIGGHKPQLMRLATAVWAENHLTPHEKKLWRSLFASARSSNERPPAVPGPRPAGVVAPVAPEASATTAAATASRDPIPSGSTTR